MHILVTDVLSCPRCGPGFGLVLLARDVAARRVREGTLACPNCREHYPVRAGVPDFGAAGPAVGADAEARPADTEADAATDVAKRRGPAADTTASPSDDVVDPAFRVLALLGIAEPPAVVLLGGRAARLGADMAARVDGLEAICVGAPGGVVPGAGVSPMRVGAALPLHSNSLRGVVLAGGAAATWLDEGARVVGRLGRMVIEDGPQDAAERLAAAGLRVLAHDGATVVASRG